MKLLVVSPDYASHVIPMLQVGVAWQRERGHVVVATGDSVRPLVLDARLDWTHLRLGKGSNSGIIRTDEQPAGEDDHLRAFFDATRAGAIETLIYQAEARRHDLLHEPERVLADLRRIIAETQPDRVLVDHVAFGARLALHALGVEAAAIVLGHPTALPAPGELYGMPPSWPECLRPNEIELAGLTRRCRESVDELASTANDLLGRLAPQRPRIDDLTSLPGHPTMYVYPTELHDPARAMPAGSVSLGSLRRDEDLGNVDLPTGTGPRVLVALGSFLSARGDLLAAAVEAARLDNWRLALAHGSTAPDRLGTPPDGSLIAAHLPQVALLRHTDVMITHGGNNSVTEACAAGVPMVVLPMSTDQFAGAASIETAGLGVVVDPNQVTSASLAAAVSSVLASDAGTRVRIIARSIAESGGASRAVAAIAGTIS